MEGLKSSSEKSSEIKRTSPTTWEVASESEEGQTYTVWLDKAGWHCNCQGFRTHRSNCKHIYKVMKEGLTMEVEE